MFYKVQIILVLLACVFIVRSVAEEGKWNQRYSYQFPYESNGKHYFYAQSIEKDGHNYFIQELKSGGKMGDETAHGFWNQHYPSTFTYSMDDKHYFFGQSNTGNNYFTQELLADGKMGKEKAHGFFDRFYDVIFPFSIEGRQFFYGQSKGANNYFFQELLSDGRLGKETANGFWSKFYDIQFPVSINGKHFIYGQSQEDNYFFIQELNSDGKRGDETHNGFLDFFSSTQFPFEYNDKLYVYMENENNWYMMEITSNGKLQTKNPFQGNLNHHFDFPFKIDDTVYFYGQNSNNDWIIVRIDMCVKTEVRELDRRHHSDYALASWNMQGANNDGGNKWDTIVRRQMDYYDIIALQESGAYPGLTSVENEDPSHVENIGNNLIVSQRVWFTGSTDRTFGTAYIYHVQNGRTNFRVSMSIVSRRRADEVIVLGPFGRASRPVIGIRHGNDYFFNIHAGAHRGNEALDAVAAIEDRMSTQLEINPRTNWIIMGDYNRDGGNIASRLRRPPANVRRREVIPNRSTHDSRRTLDFAITGAGVDNDVPMVAQASEPTISDHRFVPLLAAFLFENRPSNLRRCG